MVSAENIKDAEQRRLTWRCRRGMLELDIVLAQFVDIHFGSLPADELQAFDTLLGLPDNEFWTLIQKQGVQNDAFLQAVLAKLKAVSMDANKRTC